MKDINRKPTGELRGDAGPAMSDNGASKNPGYDLGNSLAGNSKSILNTGYRAMGGISSATKSDKPRTA